MARAHFVKKARKDVPNSDIKKGESYYWWQFRFGTKQVSRTPPKQSQLTQSEFLGNIYGIQERIEELTTDCEFETEVEDLISELETLRDECEDKRSNMPDQLQDSDSGEMLQNRVDSVQEMIDELEGIDCSIEEISDEDVKDDVGEKDAGEMDMDYDKRLEERKEEMLEERKQEVLEEIQNVSYNGE